MRRKKPVDRSARSERYQALLKAAAEKHRTTVADVRSRYEAGIVMAHEDMTTAMVAGEKIDVAAYLKLSEELQKMLPPPEPLKVEIEILDGEKRLSDELRERGRAEAKREGEARAKLTEAVKAADLEKPPAPAVEAHKPTRQGVSPSAFHDQIVGGGEVAPLKSQQQGGEGAAIHDVNGSLCWTPYANRRRAESANTPDPHPYINADGTNREPWK